MLYRFVQETQDYSDFAGGQVFVSAPGQPGFPVRLVSELFQRCLAIRKSEGLTGSCTIYDPCCGSALLLTTLAFLHGEAISQIIASDIDEDALGLARRNLALTTYKGLDERVAELVRLHQQYGKPSHAAALAGAQRLRQLLEAAGTEKPISVRLFQADATRPVELRALLDTTPIDLVITDVPYGQLTSWKANSGEEGGETAPVVQMLEALRPILSPQTVVAIATDKQQKVGLSAYRRLEQFQVGKRRMVLLKPNP